LGKGENLDILSYLQAYLGTDLITQFNITSDIFQFVIAEALTDYGVSLENQVTDTTKLRKFAVMELWKKIMVLCSASYDFSASGNSFKTSQMYDFAQKNFLDAYSECGWYIDAYIPVSKNSIGCDYENNQTGF
jgi:hypothetical protein